jgi:hypothetical protein
MAWNGQDDPQQQTGNQPQNQQTDYDPEKDH